MRYEEGYPGLSHRDTRARLVSTFNMTLSMSGIYNPYTLHVGHVTHGLQIWVAWRYIIRLLGCMHTVGVHPVVVSYAFTQCTTLTTGRSVTGRLYRLHYPEELVSATWHATWKWISTPLGSRVPTCLAHCLIHERSETPGKWSATRQRETVQ